VSACLLRPEISNFTKSQLRQNPMSEQPIKLFISAADFEKWIETEHNQSDGIWLQIAKKDSGKSSVSYPEALDIALCYGWIDGQKKKFDEQYFLQRFTPRRKRSPWSVINVEKVQKLIEAGKMREAGQKEIDRAKADGRWDAAYLPASRMTIPDDLQAALDANPEAHEFFKTLKSPSRYAILFGLQTAKKPETREKRLREFMTMLSEKKQI
jgi:uncharacterized protein YdeI (YjbR/CyaY-like superfamily)